MLTRIRRRHIDRLISVFWGVWRYRCNNFQCQWEGNLRRKREKKQERGGAM